MNKKTLFYGAIFIAIISLCFLFLFRIMPSMQIWDNYNILYVNVETDIEEVKTALHTIDGILYPDHEHFPLPSFLAPVQYHQFETLFSYEDLQSSYFFDKEKNYNLFYIPHEHIAEAQKALKNMSFSWGLDTQSTIPAIPFLFVLIFSLFLFYKSKNKAYYFSILIPFLLYCIAAPFYHIAISVCIFMLAVFTIQKYWNRAYVFQKNKHSIFCIISFLTLLVGALLLGFDGIILLFFACTSAIATVYITHRIKDKIYQGAAFKPVHIHTAKTISIESIFSTKYILIALCIVSVLTILSFTNIQPTKESAQGVLQFPSPSGYTRTGDFSSQSYSQVVLEPVQESIVRLPDFTDFIHTAWRFETYPYLKLGETITGIALPGDTIEKVDYIQNGYTLEEKSEVVAIFDDAYIQHVRNLALSSPNAGAEKLLASQKGFSRVSYVTNGSTANPLRLVLFSAFACLFMIFVFVVIKVKRR